jgi:hypothetical protein
MIDAQYVLDKLERKSLQKKCVVKTRYSKIGEDEYASDQETYVQKVRSLNFNNRGRQPRHQASYE